MIRIVVCNTVDTEKLVMIELYSFRNGRNFRDQDGPSWFEFQVVITPGLWELRQTSQLTKEIVSLFYYFI